MRIVKTGILILCLVVGVMLVTTKSTKAVSDPSLAPVDWAFEESSVELNDAVVLVYPYIDTNEDGFISISEANAMNVSVLNLSNRSIIGTLNGIENFTSVSKIDLFGNQLSGNIPNALGNLNGLDELDLGNNQLTGEIPSELGNLSNLTGLYLDNNQLIGEIPIELENLDNLNFLRLRNNHLTSIKQSTFDFLTSIPEYLTLDNQTYTKDLTELGLASVDYEFTGLPAYEQFPNYGMTFTYTLHLPDESSTVINPIIADGNVIILGSDLSQTGDYSLVATGSGGVLNSVEYTTNFSMENEEVDYISAIANGEEDVETSTKIVIKLSKVPEVDELTINDITLTTNTKAALEINKDSLTSLGDGEYELAISGTWAEGTNINVGLEKTDVTFSPDTQSTTLHTELADTGENPLDPEDKTDTKDESDNNKSTKLPITGAGSLASIIIIFIITLLSGGYLITRRNNLD